MAALLSRLGEYRAIWTLVYLSALGAISVMGVEAYLGVPFSPGLILTFTAFVFGIYLLNRTTDGDEDLANDQSRLLFYLNRGFYFRMAVGVLGGASAFLVFQMKFAFVHALLLAMGVVYSFQFLPWLARRRELIFFRIKEITWFKNLSVAVLWGACVVVIPAAYAERSILDYPYLWLLGFGLVFSTFNNTLFDDIRDKPGDTMAGLNTLPIKYGEGFCYRLLYRADIIWSAALGALFAFGLLDWGHFLLLLALALFPLVYLGLYRAHPGRRYLNGGLAEADLLIFGVGLYLLG